MKKESIVQFISFVTNLELEDFSTAWDHFAKELKKGADEIRLFEAVKKPKNRFRYISILESKTADFRFAFMKGRNSETFPERNVKVVQLGGYSAVQIQHANGTTKNTARVMAFLEPNNFDIDYCKKLSYSHLNIYEAYFENSAFSYIAEFFVPVADAPALLQQLEEKGGMNAGVYKACPAFVVH
jgi:hypothetical protein